MKIGDMFTEIYLKPKLSVSTDEELVSILNFGALIYTTIIGIYACILPAPYGRFKNKKYGLVLPARIAWAIQEVPSVIVTLFLLWTENGGRIPLVNFVLVLLFFIHYTQRAFIQPFLNRAASPIPLIVTLSAFVFTLCNGYLQVFTLINVAKYSDDWSYKWNFRLGLSLFATGFVVNVYHDHLLRKLRDKNETSYKIPHGGLFGYISCANYFGEIVEWWGFYLASQTYSFLLFACFTTLFLGSRAFHHHKFYNKKFDNYPKHRKAVIPFIL